MEYTQHPISAKIKSYLEAKYSDPNRIPVFVTMKLSDRWQRFAYTTNGWMREKPVKEIPVDQYCIVYGNFPIPGGILCVIKLPADIKRNWHKRIFPAINRLIRECGYNPNKVDNYVDGIEKDVYDNRNYDCYDYNGTDFVRVKP